MLAARGEKEEAEEALRRKAQAAAEAAAVELRAAKQAAEEAATTLQTTLSEKETETELRRKAQAALPPSPVRRLAALLPPDAAVADQVGARLKLSNKARKRLVLALGQDGVGERPRALAFRIGTEAAIDRLLLDD